MNYLLCFYISFAVALLSVADDLRAVEATATISVDTANPGWTISNYLTGAHTVYGSEPDDLWQSPVLSQWMKKAKVGIIRYPGGTAVQHWHWDDPNGINFKNDSWDPKYKSKPSDPINWMSLDEFMKHCSRIGAEPMVGINTLSGKKYNRRQESLDSAKRLIQHCKDKGYKVKHWYIGNECFIGWGAKSYAKDIDDYARVLKSVDPDITIVGDWKFGPETKKRFEQSVKIATLSKELDVLEIHEKYALGKNGWGLRRDGYTADTVEEWLNEGGLYGGRLDFYIEKFYKEMKKSNSSVKLGFNEWAAESTDAYMSALTKADYLISMFKYPVYSACDWTLHWGKGATINMDKKSRQVSLRPAAEVFTLVAHSMGLQQLPMKSSHGNVYGFAANKNKLETIEIYLLNKLSTEVSAEVKLGEAASKFGYTMETTSFVKPGKMVKANDVRVAYGVAPRPLLPPLSFNRIVLKRR